MALTFAQGAGLIENPAWLDRIRIGVIKAALAVAGEDPAGFTGDGYAKRQQLAQRILNSPDAMVRAFAAAVAADPGTALTWWPPVPIVSSTDDNPLLVVTASAHGLFSGHVATVVGHTGNTAANGTWTVTAIDTTSFTVPMPGLVDGGATGTVQRQEADDNIQYTINSVFSDIAGLRAGDLV